MIRAYPMLKTGLNDHDLDWVTGILVSNIHTIKDNSYLDVERTIRNSLSNRD